MKFISKLPELSRVGPRKPVMETVVKEKTLTIKTGARD